MYLLSFLVPETHLEVVKNALFTCGAGTVGQYSNCAWQVLGEGQFLPLPGSNAYIGQVNTLEKVPEYKVELVCDDTVIKNAISILKCSHPYETPAYQVIKVENF